MVMFMSLVNEENIGYGDNHTDCEDDMPTDKEWQERVKNLLKAELKRRHVSYRDLAEKLVPLGLKESERNIANKIARGGFTAVFFVQCLVAIGAQTMRLEDS
jgi:Domain of unknown function (DUF6471)